MKAQDHFFRTILIFMMVILSLNSSAVNSTFFVQDEIDQLIKQSEAGNTQSQYSLGMAYEQGKNISKSYTEAAKWFRKASDAGYVPAQLRLAYYYEVGAFTDQNYGEAARLYTLAAQNGNGQAMNLLGRYYVEGLGVKRDLKRAKELFEAAIAKGELKAQSNLDKLNATLASASNAETTKTDKKNIPVKVPKQSTDKSKTDESIRESKSTPMGIIDDEDLTVLEVGVQDHANYPGTLTKVLYNKLLDKKGQLEDGWMLFCIILLLVILFITRKIMMHPQISLYGPSSIVISFLFFGALKGYFANIKLLGAGTSVILLICLVVGVVQCYRKSEEQYKIWSVLISFALGFIAYHTALILLYASGWFMGGVFMLIILALFFVFVLRLDFRGTSSNETRGRSVDSSRGSGSSQTTTSPSETRRCYFCNEYGYCTQHFEGIHNIRCDGHNYDHNCSDFKES